MEASRRRLSDHSPSEGPSGSDCVWDGLGTPFFPLSKSSSDVVQVPPCQDGPMRNKLDMKKSLSSTTCQQQRAPESSHHRSTQSGWEICYGATSERGTGGTATQAHSTAGTPSYRATAEETHSLTVNHHGMDKPPRVTVQENHTATPIRDSCRDRLDLIHPPVQRSHSDSLHMFSQSHCPGELVVTRSETSFACSGLGVCSREVPACPSLVCKQAMQLQQSNTVTICRGSNNSSPTQQTVQIFLPATTHGGGDVEPRYATCGDICFGQPSNHGGLEDTFAAYCHPLPIPTPAQLLPRMASSANESCQQRPPTQTSVLSFPRLVSSVSETGLDAKHMMHCCNADGADQVVAFTPGQAQHGECKKTRDMGTMTSATPLIDVGVQTGTAEMPPPHVFPEVSLREEGGVAAASGQKSPVKEVMWDAEGMTWEVYGASVDPEVLGLAIQKHLELQIKETARRSSKLSRQDTISSQQGDRQRKRSGVISSLKSPACCARSSSAVD